MQKSVCCNGIVIIGCLCLRLALFLKKCAMENILAKIGILLMCYELTRKNNENKLSILNECVPRLEV